MCAAWALLFEACPISWFRPYERSQHCQMEKSDNNLKKNSTMEFTARSSPACCGDQTESWRDGSQERAEVDILTGWGSHAWGLEGNLASAG